MLVNNCKKNNYNFSISCLTVTKIKSIPGSGEFYKGHEGVPRLWWEYVFIAQHPHIY